MTNFILQEFKTNQMDTIPSNWMLIEEWDNNYIFENMDTNFCVNVNFTEQLDIPYDISFIQLKGDFNIIGTENGAYSTNAITKEEALQKSFEMMVFIDSK